MTTLKDTLEDPLAVPEGVKARAAVQASVRANGEPNHPHSDAVFQIVAVKVGSKGVGSDARDVLLQAEPFEEQTSTMIVFPQGGVFKLSSTVVAGQVLAITNLKSGHDASCRVVRIRACGPAQRYVEIEFTHPQPGYWGVQFPSDTPNHQPAAPIASPSPLSTPGKTEKEEHGPIQDLSRDPGAVPQKPATVPANPSVAEDSTKTLPVSPTPSTHAARQHPSESPLVSIEFELQEQIDAAPTRPVKFAKNPLARRWTFVTSGIAAVVLVAAVPHFRRPLDSSVPKRSIPVTPATTSKASYDQNQSLVPRTMAFASNATASTTDPAPTKGDKKSAETQPSLSAPETRKLQNRVPNMFGALNAHPISPQRGAASDAPSTVPLLDGANIPGDENGTLPVIAGGSPLRNTTPPRLISSVPPIYPTIASSTGIDGDVVVLLLIDPSGNVADTKVLRGSPMLRSAATDSVRQWKYQPSLLDGQPVAAQVTVTIRFHH